MPKTKPRKFAASIEEIARLAKMSITTVSMVLNGKAEQYRISSKTQKTIVALAKKLNYSPNPSARNLRLKKTRTIGLVIADFSNYFFTQVARFLEEICRENGYLLQISASEDDERLEEQIIQNFISKSVDGLIIASVHRNSGLLSDIVKSTPTVFIDRRLEGVDCSWVESNNYDSACKLVEQLAKSHPQEIAYIGGIRRMSSNVERRRAYDDVLKRNDIQINRDIVIERNYMARSGYRSMLEIIESLGRSPDALFTASFTLLEGALTALKEKYVALPDNIKISTYDDHPLLDFTSTRINSARQDYQAIAKDAFGILEEYLRGNEAVMRKVVPASVLIRDDDTTAHG